MGTPRKKHYPGQNWFGEIQEQAKEASFQDRPVGMPCLSVLRTEVKRMGLPVSDADYVYDHWLTNGFKTKTGKIRDWKAALRNYHRNRWLPSLRGPQAIQEDAEIIKARIRRMRDSK